MISNESLTFTQNIEQKIWERLEWCPQIVQVCTTEYKITGSRKLKGTTD